MTAQVLLKLSDRAYRRAKSLAEMNNQEISEAIAEYLEAHLPAARSENIDATEQTHPFPRPEHVTALEREKEAYTKLFSELKQKYFGQYVAIYQGKLIDVDPDFGALVERVRSSLPNEIVWMSQVEEEEMPTIVLRSPRFVSEVE